MFFGKKEEKAHLPDLPPLPRLTPAKPLRQEPSLPQFPDNPQGEMGEMISPPGRRDVMMSPVRQEPQKAKVVEMEEWHPQEMEEPEMMEEELPAPPQYVMKKRPQPMMQVRPVEDVFVRIDKFHTARKSLSEIQHRLGDIDELVKRIRDTKMREEQELSGWERELMQIKSRVQTVSDTIFEKVE